MSYKDEYADVIAGQFHDLENKIMQDIIRRIRKEGQITSTADWQINRLSALGYSSAEIESMIKDALNATWPEMFELYDEVIDWEYVRNAEIYEQVNEKFIPYEENKQLQQFVEAAKNQTQESLANLTNSLGVVSNINGQMTFLPLTEFYKRELDAAVLAIASGAMDYNSVLKKTVNTLANSGIRTIDYASGYNSRLPVAVRRSVMTGVSQLTGQISQMNAQKLGTDYFEVDYHSGARPEHREWQGKVYSMQQLIDVCGLGTATGLNGINCYHEYYPFFPGISERNYTDEWLEEQNRLENTPKAYRGKEYTTYEALQKQRQMETSMRTQRQKVRLLEEGKADPDDIIIAKARYQGQLAEYKEFSATMNLKPRMNRVYIDGLGRIAPNDYYKKAASYLIKDADPTKPDLNLRRMVENTISKMPTKVVKALDKTIIEIGVVGASRYDYAKDIMYIARNANTVSVIHEIGHMVDNKLVDKNVAEELKQSLLHDVSMFGLKQEVYYDADKNPVNIFVINTDKLISEYQGRVYVENIVDAFDDDLKLRYDKLREFTSEAFREYIENPEELKLKSLDMYNMINEAVKDGKTG